MTAGTRRVSAVSEINVTPFADVIVVLLIIFMIAVPMLSQDRAVTLPDASNSAKHDREPLAVTLRRDGLVRIGERLMTEQELLAHLRGGLSGLPETERVVHVRADEGLPYSAVERLLEVSRQAGADQVALMTAPRSQ